MKKYDAIIIGAGQAGVPLSKKLANAGWHTLLVERDVVGGTCVNYGCTPTKTMVSSARMAYQARRSSVYGIETGETVVDIKAVIARKQKIVDNARNGSERALKKTENLDLLYGEAAFTGDKTIEVTNKSGNKEEFTADKIFINTGARTAIPAIEGIDTIDYLTSTSILDIQEIPGQLLIIGASYIGLEFGQMFRRYGSEVTILEHSPRFLPKEDEDVADEMKKILAEDSIHLVTGAQVKQITKQEGKVTATVTTAEGEQVYKATHVLIAAGRTPNSDALNLDKAGIKAEKGYIQVNDKLETNIEGIYAMGDVKGGPAFTHISYNDYVVITRNLLEGKDETIKDRPVPYCMFTDPELGRVGMNEDEARKKGLNIKVAKLQMTSVARAVETSDTRGLMKAVVDADTKKILGVAILGAQGGEIMSVLQMAMQGGLTYDQLRSMVFAHPTFSESINNLFMTIDKMP